MKVHYPYTIKHSEVHPGVNLAWCDEGKGETTLLFIHGLAGYLPLWKHQIDGLKSHYRCVAVDLPGNGLSSNGDFPYTMFFFAETIARFIEKEQLKNVVLVGHSMGGHVSMVLSLRYPHLVQKLVLVAPSGIEAFGQSERMVIENLMAIGQYFSSHANYIESSIKQSFYRKTDETDTIISDIKKLSKAQTIIKWNKMINACINSMLNEQIADFLPGITQPTLLIFGEKDEFIPNKLVHPMETVKHLAMEGCNKIKDSKLELIPFAGHFVHIEKFDTVNTFIMQFAN